MPMISVRDNENNSEIEMQKYNKKEQRRGGAEAIVKRVRAT